MPWIIEYQTVLDQMRQQGLRCNYYNSGAFGFDTAAEPQIRGWIGPNDGTIKPAALPLIRHIAEPHEPTLARLATQAWQEKLPGRVWAMPMSHWHYELQFGSRDWMPALLEKIEIDPGLLAQRNNAAAIEFSPEESTQFTYFIQRLLEMLMASDFMLAFPRRDTLCTLHHHKQLWWTTTSPGFVEFLDTLAP